MAKYVKTEEGYKLKSELQSVTSVNGQTGDVTVFSGSWNDLTDKPFYESPADIIFSEKAVNPGSTIRLNSQLVAGNTYTIIIDGTQYQSDCVMDSAGKFSLEFFTSTQPIGITQTSGLQYKIIAMFAFTLSIKDGTDELVQLDEKFIPDSIARVTDIPDAIINPTVAAIGQTIVVKSVDENGKPTEWESIDPWVINSSTEGSTKKFKLTIDDAGVLTAAEIVTEEVE